MNVGVLQTLSYRASVNQALPTLTRNAKDMQRLGRIKADINVDALIRDVYAEIPGVPDSLF
ncbi:MAG: hypothetical protein LBT01_08205 [Spirochaetaceae bacterium]|nr:hypothetical protein [Spirochaetaceae bacterium]